MSNYPRLSKAAYATKRIPSLHRAVDPPILNTQTIYAVTDFNLSNGVFAEGQDSILTADSVADRLATSNSLFTLLIGQTESLRSTQEDVLYMAHGCQRVEKYGFMQFYMGPNTDQVLDVALVELKAMLNANLVLLNLIKSEQTVRDHISYIIDRLYEAPQNSPYASKSAQIKSVQYQPVIVYKYVVDSPPICDLCRGVVAYEDMNAHQATSLCYSKTAISKEQESGWSAVEFNEEAVLVQTKHVPYKMVAVSYDMWAPKWVSTAIESYNTQKGFAGLSLAEYLDKLAGLQSK